MSQERTEGIVLRAVDFSETSRIVTFLTPDRGKLACLAIGVKRPKSPMAGQIETFNRVELDYYWRDSRSVQKLAAANVIDGYAGLKADLDKTVFASIPLELAYRVAHENEPSQGLYAALVAGLEGMAGWPGPPLAHGCWHMLRMLEAAGFEPALESGSTHGPVSFAYDSGVVPGGGDVRVPRSAIDTLAALNAARSACPDVTVSSEVFWLLVRFAERHLECHLRSAHVARQVLPV